MKLQKIYSTTDVHVLGEVFRIVDELPFVHYQSLKEWNDRLPSVFSDEMALLLNEPRGFAGINGCLVVPPFSPGADAAVIFFNHEGTVSVHYGGIIAVVTALLENGKLKEKKSGEYLIETIHGVILAVAVKEKEQVVSVRLELDDCSVVRTDALLLETAYTVVQTDQRYALFDNRNVVAAIGLSELSELKEWGKNTWQALKSNPDIDGVILMDDAQLVQGQMKSITFRKDGWIVRSPGFGATAACFTRLLAKGDMKPGEILKNESVFGSCLVAKAQHKNGKHQFSISARGFITGLQTFVLDPTDPLPGGFLLK